VSAKSGGLLTAKVSLTALGQEKSGEKLGYLIFDSAAKPHQIRVFSRLREKPALKKKDLNNATSPKSAQDGGFAAESNLRADPDRGP